MFRRFLLPCLMLCAVPTAYAQTGLSPSGKVSQITTSSDCPIDSPNRRDGYFGVESGPSGFEFFVSESSMDTAGKIVKVSLPEGSPIELRDLLTFAILRAPATVSWSAASEGLHLQEPKVLIRATEGEPLCYAPSGSVLVQDEPELLGG